MKIAIYAAALAAGIGGAALAAETKYDGDYGFYTWATSPESFCQPRPNSGVAMIKGGTVLSPQGAGFVINGTIKDDGWVELLLGGGSAAAKIDGKFKTDHKAEGAWAKGPCTGAWTLERKK